MGVGRIIWVGETKLHNATIDTRALAIINARNPSYAPEHLSLDCAGSAWVGVTLVEKDCFSPLAVVRELEIKRVLLAFFTISDSSSYDAP